MASGTIKNIIFDLGGVLIDIDPQKTANAFAALSNSDPVDIIGLHNSHNFFMDYEKGLITDAAFRDNVRKFLNTDITDETIDTAWGELLLDFPSGKIEMLENARKNFRIFLLSNTNNIHRIKFERLFKEATQTDIRDFFENVHYSFEMHARKPDEEIFLKVLAENDIPPEKTMLIDDNLPNIETAIKLGFETCHVQINQEKIGLDF